jgi:hypothetical protein
MRTHYGRFLVLALLVGLAGCSPTPKGEEVIEETAPIIESIEFHTG